MATSVKVLAAVTSLQLELEIRNFHVRVTSLFARQVLWQKLQFRIISKFLQLLT